MSDRNGCTCATRDPWATEHRPLCPLRSRATTDEAPPQPSVTLPRETVEKVRRALEQCSGVLARLGCHSDGDRCCGATDHTCANHAARWAAHKALDLLPDGT